MVHAQCGRSGLEGLKERGGQDGLIGLWTERFRDRSQCLSFITDLGVKLSEISCMYEMCPKCKIMNVTI
jgi:hypothetical protein